MVLNVPEPGANAGAFAFSGEASTVGVLTGVFVGVKTSGADFVDQGEGTVEEEADAVISEDDFATPHAAPQPMPVTLRHDSESGLDMVMDLFGLDSDCVCKVDEVETLGVWAVRRVEQ